MLSRSLPFFLYLILLGVAQGLDSAQHAAYPWVADWDLRWLYPIRVALVAAALWRFRRGYAELRPFSTMPIWHWLAAILVGGVIFALWINLDRSWLVLGSGSAGFNPNGGDGAIDWRLAAARLSGAALVVPLMEELFWRSFLMRWIDRQDFMALRPAKVSLRAFLIASVLFGFEHHLWFAGIVAGLAYGGLYMRTNNLWAPVAAHGVTNGLLGMWVLHTGNWQFW